MKKIHYSIWFNWLLAFTSAFAQTVNPYNLVGSAAAYNQVNLSWKDNYTSETGFIVERDGFGGFTKIGDVGPDVTTYRDNTVNGNGTYTYRVRAVVPRSTIGIPYSNEVTVNTPSEPPTMPTNLDAVLQSPNLIRLTWSNPGAGLASEFLVERGTSSRGPFNQIAVVPYSRSPFYEDREVLSGTQYCYQVRARGPGGTSAYSNVDCESTPSATSNVSDFRAETLTSSAIKLTWTPFGKESPIDIERSIGQTGRWEKRASVLGESGQYTDDGLTASTEYCYRIAESGRDYSVTRCATTLAPPVVAPVTPTGLSVLSISASQLQLFWADGNVQPVTFEISRADKPGGMYLVIQSDYAQKIYDDTRGLNPASQYCYKVRAKNNAGVFSNYSNEACNTTKEPPVTATAPKAPTDLTIMGTTSTQVDMQWSDQSDNETGFQVERATSLTGAYEKIQDLDRNATSFSDKTVQSSTQYCYRVRAVANALASDYTESKCATTLAPPPGAPINLQATAGSPTQIDLVWTAPNAAAGDFYEVQRATTSGGNYQPLKNVPLGANGAGSYSDTGLTPGTLYCYRVRRYSAPQSDFGNEACTTTQPPTPTAPNKPARLSATAVAFDRVELSWVGVSGTETGFDLEWSLDGNAWNQLASVPASVVTYTHTGLAGSTRYYYRVRAVNAIGKSDFSDPVNVLTPAAPVPPPSAPARLTATAVLATQINLTWTNTATNATGNDVETSTDGITNWTKIQSLEANATTYEHKGLTPATRYYYRIRASNQGGGTYSDVANATTPDVVPAAPARLNAVAVSSSEINLTWADVSGNETGFEIDRSPDGGRTWDKLDTVPVNTITYQHEGLTPVTRYDYRVRAVNAIGKSEYSDPANATTLDVPPGAPINLMAQATSFSAIVLTWTNSATNVTGIEIQQSMDGNVFTVIAMVGPTDNTYTNVGLTPATRYYYRIRSVNTVGKSSDAGPVNVLTPDIAPVAPDQLTAQATSYSAVSLSWADLSRNETGFEIEQSTDGGTTFNRIATVDPNVTTYEQTGLNGSTTYQYRVRAINAIGPSGYTKSVAVTTPQAPLPSIPTNLTAIPIDFDLIKLTWSPVSTNTTSVVIERSTSSTSGFVEIGKQVPAQTEFNDVGILPVATYYYRVRAVNSAGSSDYSNVAKIDAEAIINGTPEPLPASQIVYVADRVLIIQVNHATEATIQLVSLQGVTMLTKTVAIDAGSPYQHDISQLPAGLYVVAVQTATSLLTKKILLP